MRYDSSGWIMRAREASIPGVSLDYDVARWSMIESKPSSKEHGEPDAFIDAELARQHEQAVVMWPMERQVLTSLGLVDGTRILDIGCGPGTITARIAALCPNSSVVGLEPDPTLARHAERELESRPRARVHRGSLSGNQLEAASFDFAYARFVLQHTADPEVELAGALRLLRPGGTLVAVDIDDGLFAIYPEPPELAEAIRLSQALQHARGGDRRVGRKLPALLEQAGFGEVQLKATALTSSDLGRLSFARLVVSFRLNRLLEKHGDTVRPLVDAVERFLAQNLWYGMVCILGVRGVRP